MCFMEKKIFVFDTKKCLFEIDHEQTPETALVPV